MHLTYLVSCEGDDALEVCLGDLGVADGALARGVVGEGEVVQDAGPAEHVAAPGRLGRPRRVEADRAGGHGVVGLEAHLLHEVPVHDRVRVAQVDRVVAPGLDHELATESERHLVTWLALSHS